MMNLSRMTIRIAVSLLSAAFLAAITVAVTGCGISGGNPATISGKVTYNGNLVTGGVMTLHPTKGADFPVTINPDGTFSSSGVPEGEVQVAIETESLNGKVPTGYDPSKMAGGKQPPPGVDPNKFQPEIDKSKMPTYMKIPQKYASLKSSGLTWTINKGNNPKDFELTDN